jgi:hypothetical protein
MTPRDAKSLTMAAVACLVVNCATFALCAEPSVGNAQYGGFVSELPGPFVKDPQLKMSIVPQFQTLRGQAPLNCLVRMQWDGPGLLEGRVLCDIYADNRYIGSWKSLDVAINQQVSSFPLMLPPCPLENDKAAFALRAVFQTEDRLIPIDPRDLPVQARWSRQYVLGVIAPASATRLSGFTGDENSPHVSDMFQLAEFHSERKVGSEFNVTTVPVVPVDVPLDPLRLTAFDALLVSIESLVELKTVQLDAIAAWVNAGGRICLVATDKIPAVHRASLLKLVSESAESVPVEFDAEGRLRSPDGSERLHVRRGCGRVLCLLEPAVADQPEWDADVLWLFGARRDQTERVLSSGTWKTPPFTTISRMVARVRPFAQGGVPLDILKATLLPQTVRGVSAAKVVLVLGVCLLLIGPFDYYVLGRLGLRKWTWIFLPVVAVTTTWAMVRMSVASLGSQSYQRSVSVVDLDADHLPVRTSRFELAFSAIEEIRKREVSRVYRIDFEQAIVGVDMLSKEMELVASNITEAREPAGAPVRYTNNVPGQYEFHEPVRQWSPRLFRETTFGVDSRVDATPLAKVDWKAIAGTDWTNANGRLHIAQTIHGAIPGARVLIRQGLETLDCAGIPAELAVPIPPDELQFNTLTSVIAGATSVEMYNDEHEPTGLFSMVCERSPTCGPELEDLVWVDPSNPDEAVLLIGIPGEDATIFRCRLDRQ